MCPRALTSLVIIIYDTLYCSQNYILHFIRLSSFSHFTAASFEISAHLATVSSTSLAGSLVLPSNKPYCVHDTLQEENESDFLEKENSNVDYTLLDSVKTGPYKSIEFIEDNVTCAEDSEVSIEEDVCMYHVDDDFNIVDVIEAEMEDSHVFDSKQTVTIDHSIKEEDDVTIARDSIIESDQNITDYITITNDQYVDGVENEDAFDDMVEVDIKFDADEVIRDDDVMGSVNDDIILERDENSLIEIGDEDMIVQDRDLEVGRTSQDKNEDFEYFGSLLEIKKDIENIVVESHIHSAQNATDDRVAVSDDKHVDGMESERGANHVIETDHLKAHDSLKSVDAKSNVEINPDLSQQYFNVDESDETGNVILEKSTVPKTPFHSLTNFGEDDDDDELPE